jgi:hypothetical protein
MSDHYELIYPLSFPPHIFVGTKPAAVLFGEERVEVRSWRQVVGIILTQCLGNPEQRERLMNLRDKVHGKVRTIVSASDSGMRRPLKICEKLYVETHYGSQTMMYILNELILPYTGFDCSKVSIVVKT